MLDNHICPVGFSEGIIRFHQRTQPNRAGEFVAARSEPPDEGSEEDYIEQAEAYV